MSVNEIIEGRSELERLKTVPEAWFAAILMVVLVVLMTSQVFLRFFMGVAVSWLEEVIRLVFVWTVYASILVAAADDRHIRIALHLSLLPPFWQKVALGLADILWIGFNGVIIYAGTQYALSLFEFPYRLPTTGINLVWVFLIIPVGFTVLSIRVAINIVRRWREDQPEIRDPRLDV